MGDYIDRKLGGKRTSDGNEIMVDCPKCGREKLYVNPAQGVFFCFRCDYGRGKRIHHLIAELEHIPVMEALERAERLMRVYTAKGDADGLNKALVDIMQKHIQEQEEHDKLQLPFGSVPLASALAKPGRRYLRSRGFTHEHWRPYELHYGARSADADGFRVREYRHIIFIERNGEEVEHYTTRAAADNVKVKSYHPFGVRKTTLYGLNAIDRDADVVFLVEGPLDVLALPRQALGVLGSTLTSLQVEKLRALKLNAICVAFDADAKIKAEHTARMLQDQEGFQHVFLYLPSSSDGDPADNVAMPPENNVKRIRERMQLLSLKHRMFTRS